MTARGSLRRYSTAFVAASMLASSAATAAPRTVDPLVVLSVFGTAESRAAVCAAGAAQAASAAGTALAAQAGTQGCVLPVIDPPTPVVAETMAPEIAAPGVASTGAGSMLPLLLGLAAVAAAAAILLKDSDDGRINLPIPPEGVPISP